jgi:vacuolar fusion protein MON1
VFRRLITLYQILHDAIHAKSGQQGTLKLQYIRTERESVMGWVRARSSSLLFPFPYFFRRHPASQPALTGSKLQITQPFELYIAMSPLVPKSAVVNAANAISRWVQREEKRLFLRDAPVF